MSNIGAKWLFGLVSLFGVGIIAFIILNNVVPNYLMPTFINYIENPSTGIAINDTTQAEAISGIYFTYNAMKWSIYGLVAIIFIYFIWIAFYKERENVIQY